MHSRLLISRTVTGTPLGDLNGGEWRFLSKTHNLPAGRNGSSPPSLAAPRGRRPPDSPHKEQIAQRRRGDPSRPSAQRRTRRIPSAKSSGSAKCKRVGKHCSASSPRRTQGTAAPLGSPPTEFAPPWKDAITSRGVSLPPLKTPSRYAPPHRKMRRLGASALLPALPRAQSLTLRRRKF